MNAEQAMKIADEKFEKREKEICELAVQCSFWTIIVVIAVFTIVVCLVPEPIKPNRVSETFGKNERCPTLRFSGTQVEFETTHIENENGTATCGLELPLPYPEGYPEGICDMLLKPKFRGKMHYEMVDGQCFWHRNEWFINLMNEQTERAVKDLDL